MQNLQILIAEDDPTSAMILEGFLQELGYEVTVTQNGREAYESLRRNDFRILVSDWEMPEMDGPELCRKIRQRSGGAYVYIILLTGVTGAQRLVEGLESGADDFLNKPFNPQELRVRMAVAERIASMESRDLVIFSLAKLAESRDPETGAHLERVREYVRMLATELESHPRYRKQVDADFIRLIYLTSPLHDIGKVGIPDQVLLKPGKLTYEEMECMKQHTVVGATTLDAAIGAHPCAEFLQMARDIAWTHHERFDGAGYPRRLSGAEIPLCGRIMSVADVYDALTTRRVYKPAYDHATAKAILLEGRGTQFDPDVVDAFLRCEVGFLKTKELLEDPPHSPAGSTPMPILPALEQTYEDAMANGQIELPAGVA